MACGEEGPDISTIPEPIIVEFSSYFIGGSLVDGKVDDTKLEWVGIEELTGDEPGTVTFTTSIGFDEVDCEALICSVVPVYNVGQHRTGHGLFAGEEGKRGPDISTMETILCLSQVISGIGS